MVLAVYRSASSSIRAVSHTAVERTPSNDAHALCQLLPRREQDGRGPHDRYNFEQAPATEQLVLALDRLGNYGDGISLGKMQTCGALVMARTSLTPQEFLSLLVFSNASKLLDTLFVRDTIAWYPNSQSRDGF